MRHDRVFERIHVLLIHFRKRIERLLFPVEELQHHHPADVFLHVRVNTGNGDANAPVRISHLVTKYLRRIKNERQHSKCDQRQLPVHREHDG